MEIRKLALVMGAAVTIVAGGVAVTACSSSSGGSSPPTPDSGTAMNNDAGMNNTSDGSMTNEEDSGTAPVGDSGTSATCDASIPSLHPETTAGSIFCGYGAGDAGAKITCTAGSECCLGGSTGGTKSTFFPEQCAGYGDTCPNQVDGGSEIAVPIACNQIADCTANGLTTATACCLQGATIAAVPGCGFNKAKNGTAIVCENNGTVLVPSTGSGDGGAEDGAAPAGDAGGGGGAATACAGGELQVCAVDSDCPTGKTCVAGKWKIYQMGFCQ